MSNKIEPKIKVACPTVEIFEECLTLLEKEGYNWECGDKSLSKIDYYYTYIRNTCLLIGTSSITYCHDQGMTGKSLSFEEFKSTYINKK